MAHIVMTYIGIAYVVMAYTAVASWLGACQVAFTSARSVKSKRFLTVNRRRSLTRPPSAPWFACSITNGVYMLRHAADSGFMRRNPSRIPHGP